MAKKEITSKDILNKLATIFKRDIYIVNNIYCIGGNITEKETTGISFCILNSDIAETLKEEFGNYRIIYMEDVKKEKAALDSGDKGLYLKVKFSKDEEKTVLNSIENLNNIVKKIDKWDKFNWTEDELVAILSDGDMITLFTDNKDIPELFVSKVVFPGIAKNNIDSLYYSAYKNKDLKGVYELVTSLDCDMFILYTVTRFIDLK
jgi:hypothetical protein